MGSKRQSWSASTKVQIIKGWIDTNSGRPVEMVYDVVCSDGLVVDPITHNVLIIMQKLISIHARFQIWAVELKPNGETLN